MSDYMGCTPGWMCLACPYPDCIRMGTRRTSEETEMRWCGNAPRRRQVQQQFPTVSEMRRACAKRAKQAAVRTYTMDKPLLEFRLLVEYGDKLEPVRKPLRHRNRKPHGEEIK